MFSFEIDEKLGLLVSRHHAGADAGSFPRLVTAIRRLAACPDVHGRRVHLMLVDADARHPGALERQQLAEANRCSPGLIFAMVTSSGVARETLSVISLLNAREESGGRRAFATRDEALGWIDGLRPGLRGELVRLDTRRAMALRLNATGT